MNQTTALKKPKLETHVHPSQHFSVLGARPKKRTVLSAAFVFPLDL